MKRFAIIFLMLLYMIPAIGVTVSAHHCGGKITSVSLKILDFGHKCPCGKKPMKKNCCKDETKTFKLKSEQQKAHQLLAQGVDIDPKIKSIAEYKLRKHSLDVPLHLYDGKTLPFADKSFDKVFSSLVFHQLDAETKLNCLKELNRVLKPNGKLIIGDWGGAKNKWMRISFYAVQLLDGFKTTNDNVNGLMPQFISDAGFQQVVEEDFINTMIGTYSYYTATKSQTL